MNDILYSIRLARADESARIREIEDVAGELFSGLGLVDESRDEAFPLDKLARLLEMQQVWVACEADGQPVGMAIASEMDGAAYLEEIDVMPSNGQRGLGAQLLSKVCAWAAASGYPAVTLSTFRDVPWNGPFYKKHGFRELKREEWTPGMLVIREKEARHGLRIEARVFMRRDLAG